MAVEHVFADEAAVLFVLFYSRIVLVDDYAVFIAYSYGAVKLFCPVWYHFQLFLMLFGLLSYFLTLTKLVTFSILLKKSWIRLGILFGLCIFHRSCDSGPHFLRKEIYPRNRFVPEKVFFGSGGLFFRLLLHLWYEENSYFGIDPNHGALWGIMGAWCAVPV